MSDIYVTIEFAHKLSSKHDTSEREKEKRHYDNYAGKTVPTGRHGYSLSPSSQPVCSRRKKQYTISGDTFALIEAGIAKERELGGQTGMKWAGNSTWADFMDQPGNLR